MFSPETLNGQKRQPRTEGSDAERDAIRNKAVRLKLFIYTKQIHDSIVKMLNTGKAKPVATLGQIAGDIMVKFEKDAGYINDPDVLEGLSKMLIKELIGLAVASGVLTEDRINEETLFRIVGIAQEIWDKANPSRVDKGRANRMMQAGQKDPQVQEAMGMNAQQGALQQLGQPPQGTPGPGPGPGPGGAQPMPPVRGM